MSIGIVIPIFNEHHALEQCLVALHHQSLKVNCKTVVVDDGSDRHSAKLIAETVDQFAPQCNLVRIDHGGPGRARNVGFKALKSDVVCFLDADCVPNPSWLDRIVSGFANSTTDAIAGAIIAGGEEGPFLREVANSGPKMSFLTGNCAVRGEVFESVDGFDESFSTSFGEDYDFAIRLSLQGHRVVYLSGARVTHIGRALTREEYFAKAMTTDSVIRLFQKYPKQMKTQSGRGPYGTIVLHQVISPALHLVRWCRLLRNKPAAWFELALRTSVVIVYGVWTVMSLRPTWLRIEERVQSDPIWTKE